MTVQGEITPGYKQTEVGVIPEDWDVKTLGDFGKFRGGNGFPMRYQGHDFGDHPFYKVSDMNNDGNTLFMGASNHWISEKVRKEIGATVFPQGSIIFAKIGAAIFLERKRILSRPSCIDNNVMALIFGSDQTDSRFFHYVFLNIELGKLVSATALPSLNGRDIAALSCPIPPLPEQRAIAAALSDADALIAAVEAMIAKKRDLKQAAMQHLLTGKTRLPGFSGEWAVKRLGDVAEIVMGQSPASANYNASGHGLPLIQGNADIRDRKTIRRVFTTHMTKHGRAGDLLMSVRAPVGEVAVATFECCLGRGVCAIRYPNWFLYHALISKEPGWAKLSKGSTFDSVNSAEVRAFELDWPNDPEEQTAIAEVLSDMDADLAALEAQAAKARAIKQGMMQELLTGRVRLV